MIGAVIVAGGSGSRMQAPVKKQYLRLDGLPILSHTLKAIDRCAGLNRIVLVVPKEDLPLCRTKVLEAVGLSHHIRIVEGGRRRQESVLNGLNALDMNEGVVMIHDGVRPFVRSSLMDRCLAGVKTTGACIPVLPATDTLKRVDENGQIVGTLDRQCIRLAQTPQTFSIGLIRRAHQLALEKGFVATDDASVAEFAGKLVIAVPGDPDNIKITTPQDLVVARVILANWWSDGGP